MPPDRLHSFALPIKLLLAAASVVAIAGAFNEALLELIRRWSQQEEYSHGFLIPLVALWLLWGRRAALVESAGQPSWTGLGLLILAGAMLVIGKLSALFILPQLGFIVALLGLALSFGGYPLLKIVFLPLAFLVFAIPLPYFIDATLSYRLQLISSELGVFFIRQFQIPVYLEGNIIDLGTYKLQVVEACSGLRYLYPLLSLGFLAAYLFQAPFWQRAAVFLSTIPITIVMNSFRIGLVGVFVDKWGPQDADGFLHLFEGWIIFIACSAMLTGEIFLFGRLQRKPFFEVFCLPTIGAGSSPKPADRLQLQPAAFFIVLCIIGATGFVVSTRQEVVPDRVTFAGFPMKFGQWGGRPGSMDIQTERYLGLTDYIMSDYKRQDGKWVNFYIAYYASQRSGLSPHSPAVCIPGGGWQISQLERTTFDVQSSTLPFNRVLISRGSEKQIVYYWFEQRGRKVANEWLSKWYLLSDAIFRNRTDGALVRVTTPIYPGEVESDADHRLRAFTHDMLPNLNGYLPAETPPEIKPTSLLPNGNHS